MAAGLNIGGERREAREAPILAAAALRREDERMSDLRAAATIMAVKASGLQFRSRNGTGKAERAARVLGVPREKFGNIELSFKFYYPSLFLNDKICTAYIYDKKKTNKQICL